MKRIILLFVFMMVSAFPGSNDEILTHYNIQQFDKHWVNFMRDRYGCPPTNGVIEWSQCNPKIGSINYTEYNKARNLAKKLFDLVDSKH